MQSFPHLYRVTATTAGTQAADSGDVVLASAGLPALNSAPPIEFDGPGNAWSPETLLVAALADCFALSFRSVAAASKLVWTSLEVEVTGELDRVDKLTRFTRMRIHARLDAPADVDRARAERLLLRAEQVCLISNSLRAEIIVSSEFRGG